MLSLKAFLEESLVKRIFFVVVIVILGLSFEALGQTMRSKIARNPETLPAPLVDHHQHLFSPAKAKTVYDPPLPAVELPEDLSLLIRQREKGWNDSTALAALYTEDSVLLNTVDEDSPTWVKGREAVAKELAIFFESPYRITPVNYRLNGSAGSVAGYYTRGEGEAARHFGHVFFSLIQAGSGRWQIAAETPVFKGPFARESSTAEQLIAQLDEAGIERAVVLSVAYQWGSRVNSRAGEHERVKAENDYIAQQVAQYPQRLVGFCGFNPLKDYAIQELDRCQKILRLKGLKMQFGNSRVELRNPEHLAKVRDVFAAANARRMPIVVHLWTLNKNYGREDAEIFLNKILPAAPDITVQIAHMAGGGPGFTDSALAIYADAIASGDRRTRNLYFDLATVANEQANEQLALLAKRIRQIGVRRILYGTDTSPPNPSARLSWANFRGLMPLTEDEFRTIALNVAPYLK